MSSFPLSISSTFNFIINKLCAQTTQFDHDIAIRKTDQIKSSCYEKRAKNIIYELQIYRNNQKQNFSDYWDILIDLDNIHEHLTKNHEICTNILTELIKHFPYIMSESKEVRNKLWDTLNIYTDSIKETDEAQKQKAIHIWTQIAIYLEIFFVDTNLTDPNQEAHPLYSKFFKKENLILQNINKILKNEESITDQKEGIKKINGEFNTIIRSLHYLIYLNYKNEIKKINGSDETLKKISELISKNPEIIHQSFQTLIDSLNSDISDTQSKPWIDVLHLCRAYHFEQSLFTKQYSTIIRLLELIDKNFNDIPGHLKISLLTAYTELKLLMGELDEAVTLPLDDHDRKIIQNHIGSINFKNHINRNTETTLLATA